VANLSDNKHVYNKTFSHKTASGGNMQVGSLVKIKQSNIGDVGKFAIVMGYCGGKVKLHIIDTGEEWVYGAYNLELLCK